jgi:hypothetical protein
MTTVQQQHTAGGGGGGTLHGGIPHGGEIHSPMRDTLASGRERLTMAQTQLLSHYA